MTRPFNPVRIKDTLVGGGDGLNVSNEGTDRPEFQCLREIIFKVIELECDRTLDTTATSVKVTFLGVAATLLLSRGVHVR